MGEKPRELKSGEKKQLEKIIHKGSVAARRENMGLRVYLIGHVVARQQAWR